jgi:hypothetical protein
MLKIGPETPGIQDTRLFANPEYLLPPNTAWVADWYEQLLTNIDAMESLGYIMTLEGIQDSFIAFLAQQPQTHYAFSEDEVIKAWLPEIQINGSSYLPLLGYKSKSSERTGSREDNIYLQVVDLNTGSLVEAKLTKDCVKGSNFPLDYRCTDYSGLPLSYLEASFLRRVFEDSFDFLGIQ